MKSFAMGLACLLLPSFCTFSATHYVDVNGASPVPPYTNWSTAAVTIQDAIDASANGDTVLVTNGIYQTGGRVVYGSVMSNRVALTKPITVQSVNGPSATVIKGYQLPGVTNGDGAIRCAYLTNGALLAGFTLTGGATRASGDVDHEQTGGGTWSENRSAIVSNCVYIYNAAYDNGAGAFGFTPAPGLPTSATIKNSILVSNITYWSGAGGSDCTFYNCYLTANATSSGGAAAVNSSLYNCTVTGNYAAIIGGGVQSCLVFNSIVYGNNGGGANSNYDGSCTLSNSCAAPLASGAGNIAAAPLFTTAPFIASNSPCRAAGSSLFASGVDITGQSWSNPPSIGCYEAQALIQPPPPAIHYVNVANGTPLSPFTSWATAATNIQDAIDAAYNGDLVLVTNGIYQTGGRVVYGSVMTNRVALTKPITVQSVNGPSVTTIKGYQLPGVTNGDGAIRCAYLTNGALLAGFTLTGGATRAIGSGDIAHEETGGGSWSESVTATVSNCLYIANASGNDGGGAEGYIPNYTGPPSGTIINCTFVSNVTYWSGAGASGCTLRNCYLTGNVSTSPGAGGAGIVNSSAVNCTITGNITYGPNAGGAHGSTLTNCIVYGNLGNGSASNYAASTLSYCDAAPLPPGVGNISADPLFLTAPVIATNSPCRAAGNASSATGVDLFQNAWSNPPSIGCYEVVPPLPLVHYVNVNSSNPVFPYTNWSTAATNIQDAIDAAANIDSVLVTNGLYQYGGFRPSPADVTNRVWLAKPITVRSVNGPLVTIIKGYQMPDIISGSNSVRCAFITNGSLLAGFTLSNGSAGTGNYVNGGGVECAYPGGMLSNCVVISNFALGGGGGVTSHGGPTSNYPVLINCLLVGNQGGAGGGAFECTLINCTVAGNSATLYGGGAGYCSTYNSIIVSNTSHTGPNYYSGTTLYSCTTPSPGVGNISADPVFMNPTAGDYHLQPNSPCINAGNNLYVPGTTDLDGNPRISGGTVDIGAYEFQNPASTISYAWLQQYGLATDGSADNLDFDHDGLSNYAEWRAGTNPTNAASVLQLVTPTTTGTNPVITWQSVTGINYYLQRTLGLSPAAFQTIATNLPGQTGTTSYTDTNAPAPGPWFYRVGVQ